MKITLTRSVLAGAAVLMAVSLTQRLAALLSLIKAVNANGPPPSAT